MVKPLLTALRNTGLYFALAVMLVEARGANTYFVSPTGSDSNPGTQSAPFQTLANAVPRLNAGDTLYLLAGTYRETLTAVRSGTSNAPITIAAYNNEVATISGCDVLTNTWSFTSNGIYAASVGWNLGEGYNQVFVDGVMQYEAQYPNWTATNSLLNPPMVSVTVYSNYTMVNSNFGALGNLSGAVFIGGINLDWAWQTAVISSNSGNTVFLESSTASGPWFPNANNDASDTGQGFIYGLPALLDADGEWYFNSAGMQLWLRITGGANPSSHLVEMKHRDWCVYVDGYNYLTIQGVTTRAGAILLNGQGNVLQNCDAGFLSHYLTFGSGYDEDGGQSQGGGVVMNGTNNTVTGCTIHDTAGCGVYANGGSGETITRNHIYNTDYAGTYACGIRLNGSGHSVFYNTVHDSGRDIIQPYGTGLNIQYNNLYNSGKLCKDQGVVYVWGFNGLGAAGADTRIAYNWVHDGNTNDPSVQLTEGIYLDGGDSNFQVDHNVMWNFGPNPHYQQGIKLNDPCQGHKLYHNTLVNCGVYDNGFTNEGFTAMNILLLTNAAMVATNLVAPTALDFQLMAGSFAVNPAFFTNVITYIVNGSNYTQITGQGVVLPGINDGFAGATPDSGAYEYGGPYWQPGTNGWSVNQPVIQTAGPTDITEGSASLQGSLVSAGLPAATVQVFWGATDGGTNAANWASQTTLGTNYTGSFVSLTQPLAGLAPGSNYVYRFYAGNTNGSSWGAAQAFTTITSPINLIWDANGGISGPQDGGGSWNTTSTNWWNGVGSCNFTNGDSPIFGSSSGTAGTVTISGSNIVAAGITFNASGSGNYVLAAGGAQTLTLDSEGITANVSATLALAPVFGSDQVWNIAAGQTLNVGNGLSAMNLGSNTLTLTGGGALILQGGGTLGNGNSGLTLSGNQLDLGKFGLTLGTVNVTAAAANGDTIQNGSLTAGSYGANLTSGNAILSANLLGTGGLSLSGTGMLTLSGTNDYGGGTTVNSGTLAVGDNYALGTGPLTIANSATLSTLANLILSNQMVWNAMPVLSLGTNTLTLTGKLSGGVVTAGLTLSGGGLTFGGTNFLAAAMNSPQEFHVNGGVLTLAGGSTTLSNFVVYTSGGNILVTGGTHYLVGPVVNFAGITLKNVLTITGGTVHTSRFSMGYGSGSSATFNLNGGYFDTTTFPQGGAFNFANNTGPSDVTTLNLNGGTLVTAEIEKGGGSAPAANNIINLNGGTLMAGGASGNFLYGSSLGLTVNVCSNGAVIDTAGYDITLANALLNGGGGGGLTKNGAGILTLSSSVANTYTGLTMVNAGELALSNTAGVNAIGLGGLSISNGATVELLAASQINDGAGLQANGTFNLNGNSETIDALSGSSGGIIDAGGGTPIFTVGASGGGGVFAGVIENTTGALALTKLGTGSLTLMGTNTYGGGTTVSGGTLLVNNLGGSGTGSGTVMVQKNATLGGKGIIGGAVNVQGGGTLAPGASLGTLTITNNLTLNANATALFELNKTNAPSTNDYLVVDGTFSVTSSTLTVTNLGPNLVVGDRFKLLSQPASGFSTVNLPAGYTWSNTLAVDGSIAVIAASAATFPTNLNYSVIGGNRLVFNWPAGQGWQLQSQTNNPGMGLTTNWVSVAGATPPYTNNISRANVTVFFRLQHP